MRRGVGMLDVFRFFHFQHAFPLGDHAGCDRVADHVRARFAAEGSGHDWHHIHRVWMLARQIGEAEGAEPQVTALGALLHDIADWKFHGGDDPIGPREAERLLVREGAPHDRVAVSRNDRGQVGVEQAVATARPGRGAVTRVWLTPRPADSPDVHFGMRAPGISSYRAIQVDASVSDMPTLPSATPFHSPSSAFLGSSHSPS